MELQLDTARCPKAEKLIGKILREGIVMEQYKMKIRLDKDKVQLPRIGVKEKIISVRNFFQLGKGRGALRTFPKI